MLFWYMVFSEHTVDTLQRLQIKTLSMVADVIVNEGGNEIIGVIIPRMHAYKKRNIHGSACLLKLVGQQLIMQEFVIFPLHISFN